MKDYAALSYSASGNLGDAIQTVALSRLLPGNVRFVDRMNAAASDDPNLIVNGWLGSNVVIDSPTSSLFAGVHLAQDRNLPWIKRTTGPVGARDPYTANLLDQENIQNEMIGCATLTFPRYEGPRSGICAVDNLKPVENAVVLTHAIDNAMSWPEQWSRAVSYLGIYRRAAVVYTSRLHVALPCLAFGTPVVFGSDNPNDNRFSLLRDIGFRDGEPVTLDVSGMAGRYIAFLGRLGIAVDTQSPELPLWR